MSTIEITITHAPYMAGDIRSMSPGFGTGLLDVLSAKNRVKVDGYGKFLLIWRLVAAHLRLAHQLRRA